MRLIDADALINDLVNSCNNDQTKMLPVWIEKQIDAQPTIPYDMMRKWLQTIADNQLSIGGNDPLTEYEQGKWDGLQIAFEIITEGRRSGMPVRDKVIKGLEYCEEYFNCCDKCPYWDGGTHCTADLAHDAINLLKEQETVTVHDPGAFCQNCGWMLYPEDHPKFCGNCGCPVKWE